MSLPFVLIEQLEFLSENGFRTFPRYSQVADHDQMRTYSHQSILGHTQLSP